MVCARKHIMLTSVRFLLSDTDVKIYQHKITFRYEDINSFQAQRSFNCKENINSAFYQYTYIQHIMLTSVFC